MPTRMPDGLEFACRARWRLSPADYSLHDRYARVSQMRIYLLPVPPAMQPGSQTLVYPSGNPDYGVEQDFLGYLTRSGVVSASPGNADWHYLPIFWTRWHLNHDYGKRGLEELAQSVSQAVLDDERTFTVCQYDDGPMVDLGRATLFLASRNGRDGIDIPLLRNDHSVPRIRPHKRYLASFVGRLSTHPMREAMAHAVAQRRDVFIHDGDKGERFFVRSTLRSHLALCPRGYGGSSFRFFESLQLGVPPLLLSDLDTRPFKNFIDWSRASLFAQSTDDLLRLLDHANPADLEAMAFVARRAYEHLRFGKWGRYVLCELEALR
jgi:hypothetical protein